MQLEKEKKGLKRMRLEARENIWAEGSPVWTAELHICLHTSRSHLGYRRPGSPTPIGGPAWIILLPWSFLPPQKTSFQLNYLDVCFCSTEISRTYSLVTKQAYDPVVPRV